MNNMQQIYVEFSNIKQNLLLMQQEKNNLMELITEVKNSYDNLKSSNLSGRTYDECLLNCEYFINEMNNRRLEIENMIAKLQIIHDSYYNFYDISNKMVGGNNG